MLMSSLAATRHVCVAHATHRCLVIVMLYIVNYDAATVMSDEPCKKGGEEQRSKYNAQDKVDAQNHKTKMKIEVRRSPPHKILLHKRRVAIRWP